jgi:Fe-S-cluster containining protein
MALDQSDIDRIAEYFGCNPNDKARIPYAPIIDHDGLFMFTINQPCFFHNKACGGCMIQDAKPQACIDYPFVLWAKGGCGLSDVLVCPVATKMIEEHFGIGGPSFCYEIREMAYSNGFEDGST